MSDGLSALGISLPGLLQSQKSLAAGQSADSTFGKAKNCIILFMLGGPPQQLPAKPVNLCV